MTAQEYIQFYFQSFIYSTIAGVALALVIGIVQAVRKEK